MNYRMLKLLCLPAKSTAETGFRTQRGCAAAVLLLATICGSASAQSDWRFGVPVNFEVGLNFATVERDDHSDWFQSPGTAIGLSSGFAARYRERLTFNVMGGGVLDTYNFFSSYAAYDVSHVFAQARVNVNYMFPLRRDRTKNIVVGTDIGRSFIGRSEKDRNEPFYSVRSDAYGPSVNFIAPEIGFARTWENGQLSLMLTYNYQFRDDRTVRVAITEDNGASFVASAKGDYLALRLRANFDLKGHKPLKQEFVRGPAHAEAKDILTRDTRERREFASKRRVIYLRFWDDGEIDGDTISVSISGRFILTEHGLTRRKKRVKVVLDPGENVIVVHAHNEGTVPPNTAAFSMKTGWFKKETMVFSTNMRRNESITVTY